jgi:VanZ family protein
VLLILFSTLSPIDIRPHVAGWGADRERFLAYVLAGALLCFAHPRQRWLVLGAILAVAVSLEWAQSWEATRHARPHDALVKMAGGGLGASLAFLLDRMIDRLRRAS